MSSVRSKAPGLGDERNEMIITGADEGRRGADLYHTEKYKEQNMDEIISDILTDLGTLTGVVPWVFNDPGATPDVKYECRRTYLGDAVREICELVGYDYYVDNDGELFVLHFQPIYNGSG